jgi:hypothetical protein
MLLNFYPLPFVIIGMKKLDETLKWDLFLNPEKYAELIDIEKILADDKIYRKGVERYKKMIKSGKDPGTIVVVKHPEEELYAVLNGHHRYWAQKEMGVKEIKCAVVHDFIGPLFHLTKDGYLQPSPLYTQYIRVPFKKVRKYLEEFLKEPEKLKKNN